MPPRDPKEETDAELENFLREIHNSDRPPAERRRIVHELQRQQQAKQARRKAEAIARFEERQDRERDQRGGLFDLGSVSQSGLHDIRDLEVALEARRAAEQLELERDALKQRLHEKDLRKLRYDVLRWAVLGLLAAVVTLLWRLAIAQHGGH